jgi:hypothetical protein
MRRRMRLPICEACGKNDTPAHRAGIYHRHRPRINAVLKGSELTLKQIARRFDVTYQRMQQIARQSGYSGRARQMARTLKRHGPVVIPEHVKIVAKLAEQRGLVFKLVSLRNGSGFNQRRVIIAGRRCVIRKVVRPHPNGPARHWLYFRRIKKDRWPEFVVLPFNGDAFIVPARMYRGTIFVFGRKKQAPGKPNTIKWNTFYGAWGQLRSSRTQKR